MARVTYGDSGFLPYIIGGDPATIARPSNVPATTTLVWLFYATEPVNMGANDLWIA